MSSFLLVVPPFAGHVNPLAGVADELTRRGHRVAWAGEPGVLARQAPGAVVHACAGVPAVERPAELRGFGALQFLWERVLVPLAEAMVPGVEAAVAAERPDVVVVDQQAFAGALVAERLGLTWATTASTSSELVDPLAAVPKAAVWVEEQLAGLRKRFGDPHQPADLRFSPHLVLAFTTAALAGPRPVACPDVRFVGPIRRPEPAGPGLELDGEERPLVYVSMGTVNAAASSRFLRECVDALRARPGLRAVVADPGGAITDPPDNVCVRATVPQLAVLDRAAVAVCHAGHNTVSEALARGVPLVLAPIRDDQPIVARQVVDAKAGIAVRFAHARARHIGDAVDRLLADPAFAGAATAVRESFDAAGGAPAAADHLESLAG